MVEGESEWRIVSERYPEPVVRRLDFQSSPLALYEDRAILKARLVRTEEDFVGADALLRLRLRVQACNDRVCLQLEWLPMIAAIPNPQP
mgnify:CR=1 FL=1